MTLACFSVTSSQVEAKSLSDYRISKKLKRLFVSDYADSVDKRLREAIFSRDVDGVRRALDDGAKANKEFGVVSGKVPSLDFTILFSGLSGPEEGEQCCITILELLLERGAKIRKSTLHCAIRANYPRVVQLLLDKGTNPNTRHGEMTAVEVAEQYGYHDIVEILIRNGGKPVHLQKAVQLRLINSAQKHNIIEMEKALKQGARINEVYKDDSALYCAMEVGDREYQRYATVAYLLQKGANPNSQGRFGTALHNAILMTGISFKYSEGDDAKKIYPKLIIEALLDAGGDVSARNKDGMTPLHTAAKFSNLVGTEMLIEAGAKIMPKDKKGKTPLDYAESAEMIKLLKAHGAKEQY